MRFPPTQTVVRRNVERRAQRPAATRQREADQGEPEGDAGRSMRTVATRIALVLLTVLSVACIPIGGDDDETGLACQRPPEGELLAVQQDGDVVMAEQFPGLVGMTSEQAAETLADTDLAVSWRWYYPTDPNDPRVGYAECWCVAPPDGVVQDAIVTEGGWLIVTVARDAGIAGGRPQPRLGWGCEADEPGESSPSAASEPKATQA